MWWSWLRTWRRGASASLTHWHVVMYTRRGCHLCEQAWELLEQARGRYGFTLQAVDVDTDPELAARYGLEVPVVTVNGRVRFRGIINRVLLDRLLRAGRKGT